MTATITGRYVACNTAPTITPAFDPFEMANAVLIHVDADDAVERLRRLGVQTTVGTNGYGCIDLVNARLLQTSRRHIFSNWSIPKGFGLRLHVGETAIWAEGGELEQGEPIGRNYIALPTTAIHSGGVFNFGERVPFIRFTTGPKAPGKQV